MTSIDREPIDSTPEAKLQAAKDAFRVRMLNNDAFFGVVAAKIGSAPSGLPDFEAEPVAIPKADGIDTWGIRLGYAQTTPGPVMAASIKTFEHIELGDYNAERRSFDLGHEFMDALGALNLPDRQAAAEGVVQDWISGVKEINLAPGEPIGIDPMGSTFELVSVLDRTMYLE